MNSNTYQLGSNSFELNQKADKLMEVITFLSNERVYAKSFPEYSTIKYCGIDETELIEAIEDLEKVYCEAKEKSQFGYLHHKAHTHYLSYNRIDDYYHIYPNNTEYGTDQNFSAPISGGKTALQALQNAWKNWSIPPVLILNSGYYLPDVDIHMVYSTFPWNEGLTGEVGE